MCVLQCSVCVDGHLGTPVDGHQCYLQMDLDKDYYFEPLLKDRTLFFVILPKYLNVDIRIMIDVKIGGERCLVLWCASVRYGQNSSASDSAMCIGMFKERKW